MHHTLTHMLESRIERDIERKRKKMYSADFWMVG
jgi:hypothetical protein